MATESHYIKVVATEHHHNDERDAESLRLIEELKDEIIKLLDQPRYALISPWLA